MRQRRTAQLRHGLKAVGDRLELRAELEKEPDRSARRRATEAMLDDAFEKLTRSVAAFQEECAELEREVAVSALARIDWERDVR